MPPRRLRTLLLGTIIGCAAVALGAGGAGAAGGNPPQRDHGRGVWFTRVCSLPIPRVAECGAQVVTNQAGQALASASPPAGAYGPAQFHGAYSLPASAPGTPTIGIVDAYNDPNIESDLATYDSQYGLPACTTANGCFRKVDQTGGTSYPSSNSGWSLEIALDVETAHEICQNCKILLVEASSNSFANLGAAENEAAKLGASVISNSWGGGEWSGETSDDASYFDHPGIPITASAGDNGYGVEYPAASQYVTAVGGTTLNVNADNGYAGETVWSGTGSGCSAYEPKPTWQHDSGCSHRTVTDVSADADPNTGAAVYDSVSYSGQTGWFQVGGTSLASPLIAAAYALGGDPSGVDFGATPYEDAAALHDVTSGSNGSCSPGYLCTAEAGYDGPTGLGTPNGTDAFTPKQATPDFSLSASPSALTVTQGTSGSSTISVSPSGGFDGSVSLAVTGLPAGVTAGSLPAITGSGSEQLTLTASSSAAAGTSTVTVTGTSGSLTHTTTLSLTVQQATQPDFSLSASPSALTVTQGTSGSSTISVSPSGGFDGSVSLAVTGLPAGVTAGSLPAITGSGSEQLTLTASSSAAAGTSTVTVTGTSGSLTHTTTLSLTVQQAPAGDFSLSVSPSRQSLFPPGSVTYTVTITPVNGFTGQVSLAVSGVPSGLTASFSSNPASSTSTLTVTAPARRSWTTATLTITGTSGSLAHSVSVRLTVF